jgi:hypothetical protein
MLRPALHLDLSKCFIGDPFMSGDWNLHPQIMITLPFPKHASHKKPLKFIMHVQTGDYFTSSLLSSCLKSPASSSHYISKPPLWGGRFEMGLSPLHLAALQRNSFVKTYCSVISVLCSGQKWTYFSNKRTKQTNEPVKEWK